MKLGVCVGENNWTFFEDIYRALAAQHATDIFRPSDIRLPVLRERRNRWARDREMRRVLRANDVCFFEWAGELLVRATQLRKRSVIVTRLHSFELFHWAEQIEWNNVDKVILVSRAMERMFHERYPAQTNKTAVINNGCRLDQFRPFDRRSFQFNLGMLNGITPIKRIYEIVLTVSKLRRLGFPARLHVGGRPKDDPRYAVAVHNLVERLNLTDCVVFDGHVEDTPRWLQKIDILISNSYWEGQQMALIEGMAAGCYCLSHHWSGADEVLPVENLFISDDDLITKITDYAQSPLLVQEDARAKMRQLAVERFDVNQTTQKILALVGKLPIGG